MAETMPISQFKATCLAVLERVRRTGQRIVITRRGEPVAEVGPPPSPPAPANWLGTLHAKAVLLDDLIEPAGEGTDWDVLRD
jgi:prevent-host-death family protein